MFRYVILAVLIAWVPALAQKAPEPGPMQAFTSCAQRAANRLDDRISAASAIASKVSEFCKKEWVASSPAEEGMAGPNLAEFRARAERAKQDLAVAAVLEERATRGRTPKLRPK
jgi:hypothetical protein